MAECLGLFMTDFFNSCFSGALDRQRQMYEEKIEELRNQMVPMGRQSMGERTVSIGSFSSGYGSSRMSWCDDRWLILSYSSYTFHHKSAGRIWCCIKISTTSWVSRHGSHLESLSALKAAMVGYWKSNTLFLRYFFNQQGESDSVWKKTLGAQGGSDQSQHSRQGSQPVEWGDG